MYVEWDGDKNLRNQRKHDGITFESAALVFADDRCQITFDRIDDDGEIRWHAVGAVKVAPQQESVLLVVHVYREFEDGEEYIRILSARKAGQDELRRYQEEETD